MVLSWLPSDWFRTTYVNHAYSREINKTEKLALCVTVRMNLTPCLRIGVRAASDLQPGLTAGPLPDDFAVGISASDNHVVSAYVKVS